MDVKTSSASSDVEVWVIVSVKVSTKVTPGFAGAERVLNEPKSALVFRGSSRVAANPSNRIWCRPD